MTANHARLAQINAVYDSRLLLWQLAHLCKAPGMGGSGAVKQFDIRREPAIWLVALLKEHCSKMYMHSNSAHRAAKKILAVGVSLTMFATAAMVQVAAAERDAATQPVIPAVASTAQTGPLPPAGAAGIQAAQGVDLDDQTLVLLGGIAAVLGLAAVILTQGTSKSTSSTTSTQ